MADLQLVLVTPEKTLLDCPVASIRVPLFDGSAGIYPGRAPLVGRLGIGELRFEGKDGQSRSYFIDGGFVQIKGPQVSVLTNSATSVLQISRKAATLELEQAVALRARSEEEFASSARRLERARKLVSLATID